MTLHPTDCPPGIVPYRIELKLNDGQILVFGARVSLEMVSDTAAINALGATMTVQRVMTLAAEAVPAGQRQVSATGNRLALVSPIAQQEAIARIASATLWVFNPQGAPTHEFPLEFPAGQSYQLYTGHA